MDSKMLKRNNKGFSLVELIVVILIIAILAVALAPQIIRYVTQARSNSDENNKAILLSAAQAAVSEFLGNSGDLGGKDYVYEAEPGHSSASLINVAGSSTSEPTVTIKGESKTLIGLIKETTSEFPKINEPANAKWYITVLSDGTVNVEKLAGRPGSLPEGG